MTGHSIGLWEGNRRWTNFCCKVVWKIRGFVFQTIAQNSLKCSSNSRRHWKPVFPTLESRITHHLSWIGNYGLHSATHFCLFCLLLSQGHPVHTVQPREPVCLGYVISCWLQTRPALACIQQWIDTNCSLHQRREGKSDGEGSQSCCLGCRQILCIWNSLWSFDIF